MKNIQGKIILVDGIAGSGKTTFIENLKKQIKGAIDLDSSEITKSLYTNKYKKKYEPFKLLNTRNKGLNFGNKENIIIDRDIIGALAFYIYYFDEEKKLDYPERFFGDKAKFTKFYEDEDNLKQGNNFKILTNRNAIKNIIKEHIKNFPKGVKKELYYFFADKKTIRERLINRQENKKSGTKNKHYEDLISNDEYYNRYQYSIDLAFLLFNEVVAEEGELNNWKIKQINTSNFKTNKL